MSGICVLWNRDDRPADTDLLWNMLQAAKHRGPDGMWIHREGALGWGFARLVVTTEDLHEQQPVVSPRTGCQIAADVRLDNRDDIVRQLSDCLPESVGDAELILCAYEAWGDAAIPRLVGDFAFVIWDPRSQSIVAARDTSGQRSLYYRLTGDCFVAASEIQQIVQDPRVTVEPNEDRIRDFLTPGTVFGSERDGAATFYSGISAVPAGHVLVVDRFDSRVRPYWEFPVGVETRYRNDGEYAEHFRSLFGETVRARLRSVHPVACLLSGGLDSSSVACTAQELYRSGTVVDNGFVTVSSTFDGQDFDERHLILAVQRKYGFRAEFVPSAEQWGKRNLLPSGFQEGPYLASLTLRDALMGKVAENRARVLLSGDVADNCVGGTWLVFDTLIRELRIASAIRLLGEFRRRSSDRLSTIAALYCLTPFLPLALQRLIHTNYARRGVRRVWDQLLPAWLAPGFADDLRRHHLSVVTAAEERRTFASPTRECEYRQLYPPNAVRSLAPWSIQAAHPYADRRLHEFLLSIPPTQKFDPDIFPDGEFYGRSKQVVRRAMQGIIPDEIRTRANKTVFAWQVENDYLQQWDAYKAIFGPDANPEVVRRGYVSHHALWGRIEQLRDGATGPDAMLVSRIIALEGWLRGLHQSSTERPDAKSTQSPTSRNSSLADPAPLGTTRFNYRS